VLGFPNPVSRPILVGKLGWRDLAGLRLWTRPLSPRVSESSFRERERDGETMARFDEEAEDVYRRASTRWGNHIVRSAAYLNWRFVESPRPYRILAERRDGRLEGWAVVTHRRFQGRAVGAVADLVAVRAATARSLLRRAARTVRAQGLIALVDGSERGRYLAAGFVPAHRSIRLIGKPLVEGVELEAERGAWHFALGDSDLF
jgi:GNAT superfamily N-acetyltransferase